MPDDVAHSLEARLVALETRVAFQDDTVDALNSAVTEQWSALEELSLQIAELRKQVNEAEARLPVAAAAAAPPHY